MNTVPAYSAPSATEPLVPATVTRREPGSQDVLIEIRYAGICHTDIHTVRSEWAPATYPVTPGHEITGVVTAVGDAVTRHAVGDRVGVGCMVNSCGDCDRCAAGEEQYCRRGAVLTYDAVDHDGTVTHGGYSTHIVVPERFVLSIPDALGLDVAAPLLCAGISMWTPLRLAGAGPGSSVAIVGLGGLGHVGVQLAAAMGAEVSVLSQSMKKREDGLRLGASAYYATSDERTFSELAETFDLIVNTVSAPIDMDAHLSLLAVGGRLACVGVPARPLAVSVFSLLQNRRSISAAMFGGVAETQAMLDFCAEHGVAAEIETIDAARINEAYERVLASDVRYRFVIDVSTMS